MVEIDVTAPNFPLEIKVTAKPRRGGGFSRIFDGEPDVELRIELVGRQLPPTPPAPYPVHNIRIIRAEEWEDPTCRVRIVDRLVRDIVLHELPDDRIDGKRVKNPHPETPDYDEDTWT